MHIWCIYIFQTWKDQNLKISCFVKMVGNKVMYIDKEAKGDNAHCVGIYSFSLIVDTKIKWYGLSEHLYMPRKHIGGRY